MLFYNYFVIICTFDLYYFVNFFAINYDHSFLAFSLIEFQLIKSRCCVHEIHFSNVFIDSVMRRGDRSKWVSRCCSLPVLVGLFVPFILICAAGTVAVLIALSGYQSANSLANRLMADLLTGAAYVTDVFITHIAGIDRHTIPSNKIHKASFID